MLTSKISVFIFSKSKLFSEKMNEFTKSLILFNLKVHFLRFLSPTIFSSAFKRVVSQTILRFVEIGVWKLLKLPEFEF